MGRRIKVEFKRRRSGKTDYKARAILLKSENPRLVVRKTNHYIILQITKSKEARDFVICTANSAELKNFGWKGSYKSREAAFLTGMLTAKKAKEKNIVKVTPDLGSYRSTKGSKLYAALKGAIEGGLSFKLKEGMALPVKIEQFKEIIEKINKK